MGVLWAHTGTIAYTVRETDCRCRCDNWEHDLRTYKIPHMLMDILWAHTGRYRVIVQVQV